MSSLCGNIILWSVDERGSGPAHAEVRRVLGFGAEHGDASMGTPDDTIDDK
jgi:hypothetical protein